MAAQVEVLYDIRVIDTDAPSYRWHSPVSILDGIAVEKKRFYWSVMKDSRGNFTPFILSWQVATADVLTLVYLQLLFAYVWEGLGSSGGVVLVSMMLFLFDLLFNDWALDFSWFILFCCFIIKQLIIIRVCMHFTDTTIRMLLHYPCKVPAGAWSCTNVKFYRELFMQQNWRTVCLST